MGGDYFVEDPLGVKLTVLNQRTGEEESFLVPSHIIEEDDEIQIEIEGVRDR